jgi:hypothetical protein
MQGGATVLPLILGTGAASPSLQRVGGHLESAAAGLEAPYARGGGHGAGSAAASLSLLSYLARL